MKKLIALFAEKGVLAMVVLIAILFAVAALMLINPPILMLLLRIAIAALCIAAGLWLTLALIRYLNMK